MVVVLGLVIELMCLLLLVVVDCAHDDCGESGSMVGGEREPTWFPIRILPGQSCGYGAVVVQRRCLLCNHGTRFVVRLLVGDPAQRRIHLLND